MLVSFLIKRAKPLLVVLWSSAGPQRASGARTHSLGWIGRAPPAMARVGRPTIASAVAKRCTASCCASRSGCPTRTGTFVARSAWSRTTRRRYTHTARIGWCLCARRVVCRDLQGGGSADQSSMPQVLCVYVISITCNYTCNYM